MPFTFPAIPGDRPSWEYRAVTNQIPNVARMTTLGYASDADTGTIPVDIWSASDVGTVGVLNGINHKTVQLPPAGGVLMELVSDSVNDTAAGTGARTVTIAYLDANYVAASITLTMNGTTPVAVGVPILRINNMIHASAGSNEINVGNISLRTVGGAGATWSYMKAGVGVAQSSLLTVPDNAVIDLWSMLVSIHQVDSNQRAATFSLFQRSSTGRRVKGLFFGFTSNVGCYVHTAYTMPFLSLAAKTDFWIRCENVSANNTAVTGAMLALQR